MLCIGTPVKMMTGSPERNQRGNMDSENISQLSKEIENLFKDKYEGKEETQMLHEFFKSETKKKFGKSYDFDMSEKNIVNFTLLEF